jgi:hypothetical protein
MEEGLSMKFFVPDSGSPIEVWQAVKKFAEEQMGRNYADRKIFRIEYRHDGNDFNAEV